MSSGGAAVSMPWPAGDGWNGKIFVGGWVRSAGGERAVVEPATGATLGVVGMATASDVAHACEQAVEAQRPWYEASFEDRAAVMRRAGDLWLEHAPDARAWIVRESGSIGPKADFEIGLAAQECFEAAALASAPFGEVLRSNQPRLSFARRLPVGVVGVIAPFNVPLVLAIRSVAPALALGNAVVLKPDPRTAVSGGVLLAEIFAEAGLPAGLLSVLPGDATVGEAIVAEPRVRVISFTGSTRAGRAVAQLAAVHMKRVHLELGGNSALVVFDDVDLDTAASIGAYGSFLHQGQICMASSRHLVAAAVADEYVELLGKHADGLPVGDPTTGTVALGPLIDAGQRDNVHQIVQESVRLGARVVAGGEYDGLFYRPTVLAGVPANAPAYAEEIFGPVAPVVTFGSVDEAADLAASSPYGLSLGILSGDVGRAMALADRVPSGAVHINDQTIADEAVIPFGGVGHSGNGARFGGRAANLEAFTETQWVTVRADLPVYPF